MKVLILPSPPQLHYWCDGVVVALDGRYPIRHFDPTQAATDQFRCLGRELFLGKGYALCEHARAF